MGANNINPRLLDQWAVAYLARYSSSTENLRRVLLRRLQRQSCGGTDVAKRAMPLIDALLEGYCHSGLLDDAAFAVQRVASLNRRGESLSRIRARLAANGVDNAIATQALSGLREERADPDLAAACAFARRRRLGPYRRGTADLVRELAAFARAGFSRRVAEQVLACSDTGAVEALARDELV
jgi:regulatory protein